MATRGTYTFTNITPEADREEGTKTTVHLYVHWDNYEEGAATKILETVYLNLERGNDKSDTPFRAFIQDFKEVSCGEITSDPRNHPDIEYHYEIEANMNEDVEEWFITVYARHKGEWKFESIRKMGIGDFLDEHRGRRCPQCGKRPTIRSKDKENGWEVTATCDCNDRGGLGRDVPSAIYYYNRTLAEAEGEIEA